MTDDLNVPRATYRLQLNRDFTFVQATAIVPYLAGLGISHCYISPILKARPGSAHGYDIVDHNSLNPEIGSAQEFDCFVNTLHAHGMGLILDIVPNHMAVMGSDNAWWLDVLENGQSSAYAGFFDIDWHPPKDELYGKVLVPVLHDHYGAVLESGELKVVFCEQSGAFDLTYRGHRFPISPREYPRVLSGAMEGLSSKLGDHYPTLLEFKSLITAFNHSPGRQEIRSNRIADLMRDREINKRRLADLCARVPEIAVGVRRAVNAINGDPSDPTTFEELHELIKAQAFRLANWRVASDDINYRRFFDTNDLAGLRMENEDVFDATHRLVLRFVAEGKVNGLRVDHPDGLYDPAQYFERLKNRIKGATKLGFYQDDSKHDDREKGAEIQDSELLSDAARYVVIEKILTGAERLPAKWPVSGTTGYDFSNLVNGLFVDSASAVSFDRIYHSVTSDEIDFDHLAYHCRRLIIRVALASELNVLANQLTRIALAKRRTCDFTLNSLREALIEVVAHFPVYRTYVTHSQISDDDVRYIHQAIAAAERSSPAADTSVFGFVSDVLLTRIADGQDSAYQQSVIAFVMKFQQFTSPVMAKGLEDTAFYRYNRLVSLNDVGGDLRKFGVTTADFHEANQKRLRDWPHTMLATSTHDSKRSEDVRSRINVLSEMPRSWTLRVRQWRRTNRRHTKLVNGRPAPTPNDEYLLYQTLIGAWPVGSPNKEVDWADFCARIQSYMLKAIREAKQNTSWINRNAEYEEAVSSFVKALIDPNSKNKFLQDFLPFQRRVAQLGAWNSLSQTLLKLTCPGVPDIYQGNDLFDFSLVDPDNRRPLDYNRRQQLFREMLEPDRDNTASGDYSSMDKLLVETSEIDRLKFYLTWKALTLRKQQPNIFSAGAYLPVAVEGPQAEHVIAFIRRFESVSVLVVAPRLIAGLVGDIDIPPVGRRVWKNTTLLLPSCPCSKVFRNVLTGEIVDVQNLDPEGRSEQSIASQAQDEGSTGPYKRVPLSTFLSRFPVALCSQ